MINLGQRNKRQLKRLIEDGHIIKIESNYFLASDPETIIITEVYGIPRVLNPSGNTWHNGDYYSSSYLIVDNIHEQFYPPQVTFLNGSVREAFIDGLVARLQHYKETKTLRNPDLDEVSKSRVLLVQNVWQKLTKSQITKLGQWFTENGLSTINYTTRHIINQSQEISIQHVDTTTVRKVHSIFYDYTSLYIFLTDDVNHKQVQLFYSGSELTISLCEIEFVLFKKSYTKCNNCGIYTHNSELVIGLCSNCRENTPNELLSYSERATTFLKPLLLPPGKSQYSSRLTGVELEYEINDEVTTPAVLYYLYRNLKDHAIFKRDGSLTHGVEICSRPASLKVHLDEFSKMFSDETCMKKIEVKESCGMHVHVDRRDLSHLTLGKIIQFMQASKNQDFISTIAERENNRYARLGTNDEISSHFTGKLRERYLGTNLQNQNTIEFRIFKTPNNYNSFLKNMEFVDALTSFALPCNSGATESDFGYFLKYVKNNKHSYKELSKFLKEQQC